MTHEFTRKVYEILEKYKNDSMESLAIPNYWEEWVALFSADMNATVTLLLSATEEDVGYFSSVFDDIAQKSPSFDYYFCLEQLLIKFPQHRYGLDNAIGTAKNLMCEYMPLPIGFSRQTLTEREIRSLFPCFSGVKWLKSYTGFADYTQEGFWRCIIVLSLDEKRKASINFSPEKVVQSACYLGYKTENITIKGIPLTIGRSSGKQTTEFTDFIVKNMAYRVEIKGEGTPEQKTFFLHLLEEVISKPVTNWDSKLKHQISDTPSFPLDISWFYL